MTPRTWHVRDSSQRAHVTTDALKAMLLKLRGVADSESFFQPLYERDIHDPLLLSDASLAVDRIFFAIKNQQHIFVYGDYDADGISSTAIITSVLKQLGGHVTPFLPHRNEHGYGLNKEVLKNVAGDIKLLISVDCGISNFEEVAYLQSNGVDTIIIDHHTIPEQLPSALAIVHPRHPKHTYAYEWLCGAGVTWKIAQALLRDSRSGQHKDPDAEKWLLDLALLGTVADVVPLTGENRAIVRFGLEVLRRTQRPGLRALLLRSRASLADFTARDVAFQLVPRLNAAGRMDHAQPALELLLTTSDAEAEFYLAKLETLNNKRRSESQIVMREAEAQILDPSAPVIFAASATWRAGVVGLAAGKLAEKYGRPAVVVGQAGTELVGSARSRGGVNVVELLRTTVQTLEKVGGHAQAAGFTVKSNGLEAFRDALIASAAETLAVTAAGRKYEADSFIGPELVRQSTVDILRQFAPFGEGNEQPSFIIKKLPLLAWRPVGKDQKHAKCTFAHEESELDGIAFGLAPQMEAELAGCREVDVLCSIDENEFRGRRSVQLSIQDISPAGHVAISHA